MRKWIAAILCATLLFSTASADVYTNLAPGVVTVIAQDGIPLRQGKYFNADVVNTIGPGVALTLLSLDESGWAQVRLDFGWQEPLVGYVRTGGLMNGDYLYWDMCRVVNPETGGRLNLRSEPSREAPSLGQYYTGVYAMNYGQKENGYVRLRIGGTTGWMEIPFVVAYNSTDVSEIPVTFVANPNGSTVELFRSPAADAEVLSTCPNGSEAAVLGLCRGDWCHVMIGGVTGYLKAEMLSGDFSDESKGGTHEQRLWFGEANSHQLHRDPYCSHRQLLLKEPFAHTRWFSSMQALNESGLWTVCSHCAADEQSRLPQLPASFRLLWNASLEEKAAMLPGVWTLPSAAAVSPEAAADAAKAYAAQILEFAPYLDSQVICSASVFHYDSGSAQPQESRETYQVLLMSTLMEPLCIVSVDALTGEVYGARNKMNLYE